MIESISITNLALASMPLLSAYALFVLFYLFYGRKFLRRNVLWKVSVATVFLSIIAVFTSPITRPTTTNERVDAPQIQRLQHEAKVVGKVEDLELRDLTEKSEPKTQYSEQYTPRLSTDK
jgi:hypothetical protein